MALLEIREVMVRFGGVMAVGGVDLDVQAREITGLIGPNGAESANQPRFASMISFSKQ